MPVLYHKLFEHATSDQYVVLLHGAGGSSSVWFKQLREFQRFFHVLVVDLRGHGRSQGVLADPGVAYTFELVCQDVLDLMDHLRIGQAHVVGISLGSILARMIAQMAPDRVVSLVLGGAIARLNPVSRFLMWTADVGKAWVPFIWLYRLYAYILMPGPRNRESRQMFVGEARRMHNREFLKWFHLTVEVNPLLRRFGREDTVCPALYLMGSEDYMFLPHVRRLCDRLPNARLTVVPDCGHVVNIERPAAFNEAALAFIRTIKPQ